MQESGMVYRTVWSCSIILTHWQAMLTLTREDCTRVVKLLLCAYYYYYYYYFIYLNSLLLLLLLLLLRHIFKQPITITITITRKIKTAYYYYYYYYFSNYYNYFPDYYYYFPILLHYPWTKQTQHKQIIKTFITSLYHLIVVCHCVSWQLKVI